ncbi:hypothetical protein [Streptomyces sp. NPDC048411]|uniref:hypothetical protein n=1 Tax=Streptomyces sp. NPDC048411 TaxID=3157206 RepID=UPI003453786E
MFTWLWLVFWSAFALPLAVASLRGWAPRWIRRSTSPWGIRVRGVALLVIWAAGTVGPLLHLSGLGTEDFGLLATVVQVGLLLFAAGLIGGSQLGERFHRREMRRRAVDDTRSRGETDA